MLKRCLPINVTTKVQKLNLVEESVAVIATWERKVICIFKVG